MYDFEKACPHKAAGLSHNHTLPDHHPMTRAEVVKLLDYMKSNPDCLALERFDQAIPGMTCPPPKSGAVWAKSVRLEELLLDDSHKGATSKRVDAVMALIS